MAGSTHQPQPLRLRQRTHARPRQTLTPTCVHPDQFRAANTARWSNEAACPHPPRRFPPEVAPTPTSAAVRNHHSRRLWPAGSFLGDFRTPAGARNSYMGMVNYKRASRRHCHVPLGQSVDPFDESVCVTRFANEPSPPYIRSGRMHLFHDPACGGFGPKRRNHSSAAAV